MNDVLFHLAFPILDIDATKQFYVEGLGCTLGRESSRALTLGLAGHQLVAHVTDKTQLQHGIYPRHFGLV
ncbi:MAG TPA: glyoxalase, partial [Nitrospira sp.]|nr:glyoxalase [Nitrospira sp.]